MPSVFAGTQTHAGSFRADFMRMSFNGLSLQGLVVQQVQFQYQQQVTMLYEIGSSYVYYVGGRAQGTASLSRVLLPTGLGVALTNAFRDLCSPTNIQLTMLTGCGQGTESLFAPNSTIPGAIYLLEKAVLTAISGSVNAQDIVVNEGLQFMFIGMTI